MFYNEKNKDTLKFETWFRQIKNKITVNASRFPTDLSRQAYVEGRLGGEASDSLQPYLQDTHPYPIQSYQALMTHLWDQYHDHNQKETSYREFEALNMKPGMDFQAFKNKFLRLAAETGQPKTEWKHLFNRKLPADIQTALVFSYTKSYIGFDAFAIEAARVAMIIQNNKAEEPSRRGNRGNRGGTYRGTTPATGQSDQTKPTDKRYTTGAIARRHGPDKLRRLLENRLCLNCEKPGHFANDCPEQRLLPDRSNRVNELVNQWAKTPKASAEKLATEVDDADRVDTTEMGN